MAFFRELWAYVADPRALMGAHDASLRWSYLFQLHMLVAFVLTLVFTSDVIMLVRRAQTNMAKVPDGIMIEKRGEKFVVAGVPQPITFENLGMVVTIDTTGALQARPVSTTLFITDTKLVSIDSTGNETVTPWKDEADFSQAVDDIKRFWLENENKLVLMGVGGLFIAVLVISGLLSIGLVVGWSVLSLVFSKLFRVPRSYTFRQTLRVHAVCLSGPLLLWAALVAGGFGIATPVEAVAFVVYSMVALPPSGGQNQK